MSQAEIQVAVAQNQAYMRVSGRATLERIEDVLAFGFALLEQGADRLFVDLSQCQSMDSSFMGALTKIGVAARQHRAKVCIMNASAAAEGLITGLGLKDFFTFIRTDSPEAEWGELAHQEVDELTRKRTVLEVHEALMDAAPENVPRFKDVTDFMRQDLKDASGGPPAKGDA